MIETKQNAEYIAEELDKRVAVHRALRIHWTGSQLVRPGAGRRHRHHGRPRQEEERQDEEGGARLPDLRRRDDRDGALTLTPEITGIPLDPEDLLPTLTQIVVDHFGGEVKPEYVDAQQEWREVVAAEKAAAEAEAAEKAAKKAAAAAAKV